MDNPSAAAATYANLHICGLYRYPVKSLAGERLEAVAVDRLGLAGDRRWMLIDANGRFFSQRELPRMATIQARLHGRSLLLTHAKETLCVKPADFSATPRACQVWKDTVPGLPAATAINTVLSDWLGVRCQLVRLADSARRQVDTRFVPAGVHTGFADGFPVLVLSQASLDDLNRRCGGRFDAQHFRPNLLVGGCQAYAEDHWQSIQAGAVSVRLVKPCSRCAIPTVDPETGTRRGPEPLATLASYRRQGTKIYLGQNGWLDLPGNQSEPHSQWLLKQNQAIRVTPKC
jgi:uncharacterized protein YcbX